MICPTRYHAAIYRQGVRTGFINPNARQAKSHGGRFGATLQSSKNTCGERVHRGLVSRAKSLCERADKQRLLATFKAAFVALRAVVKGVRRQVERAPGVHARGRRSTAGAAQRPVDLSALRADAGFLAEVSATVRPLLDVDDGFVLHCHAQVTMAKTFERFENALLTDHAGGDEARARLAADLHAHKAAFLATCLGTTRDQGFTGATLVASSPLSSTLGQLLSAGAMKAGIAFYSVEDKKQATDALTVQQFDEAVHARNAATAALGQPGAATLPLMTTAQLELFTHRWLSARMPDAAAALEKAFPTPRLVLTLDRTEETWV